MRRTDREITDPAEIREIVEKNQYLHLALNDGGYPYVVPLHYGYRIQDSAYVFYMHCAKEGHKLDLIHSDSRAFVEIECGAEQTSGGDIPCRYGSKFYSFMGKCDVTIVDDVPEKIDALRLLMQHQTGREFEIDEKMADAVVVLKAVVKDYTAKAKKK